MPYHQARNEQGMVHTAVGYARMKNRLGTFACTSSIGPGATNMVTGAALATVNRLPVLLVSGRCLRERTAPTPCSSSSRSSSAGDVSVNDAFRPVSRYFDRLSRPEQVIPAALAAMRVLTSPAETGAVTLAFPQDVQAEAFDYPEEFLAERDWHVPRQPPEERAPGAAVDAIRAARAAADRRGRRRHLLRGDRGAARARARQPAFRWARRRRARARCPTTTRRAWARSARPGRSRRTALAAAADLVIGIGTRYSDFTTASKTAFQIPDVRFVNVNVADFDAAKHAAIRARRATRASRWSELAGRSPAGRSTTRIAPRRRASTPSGTPRSLGSTRSARPAAGAERGARRRQRRRGARPTSWSAPPGAMPGDLHKLWRTRDPKGYHVEYGYSCMGYEIAGGIGVKLAAPERDVYVLVGDGSYLMLPGELVTAVQEG